jgi:hypothetical protein
MATWKRWMVLLMLQRTLKFGRAWLLGALGGAICGAALGGIVPFFRPEDGIPPDGFSSWYIYLACLGGFYGVCVGILVVPFVYAPFIREFELRKTFWPALAGGFLGALIGLLLFPPLMAPLGVLLCIGALDWASAK